MAAVEQYADGAHRLLQFGARARAQVSNPNGAETVNGRRFWLQFEVPARQTVTIEVASRTPGRTQPGDARRLAVALKDLVVQPAGNGARCQDLPEPC